MLGDAQLETTLLSSCLALPKLSYVLRMCPPSHITKATSEFDTAMRESLEPILGGPISDWSWLKASLPSRRGGVNLRSAAKHGLVEKILAQPPDLPPHLDLASISLATAASHPIGNIWRILMCLCDNTICQRPSKNPSTNNCCHLSHPLAPEPWPSRLPCQVMTHIQDLLVHLPAK